LAFLTVTCATINAQIIELDYNFRGGDLGWTAGFADYPPTTNSSGFYELFAELRFTPRKVIRKPQLGLALIYLTHLFKENPLNAF
jgi:hypothetical protein